MSGDGRRTTGRSRSAIVAIAVVGSVAAMAAAFLLFAPNPFEPSPRIITVNRGETFAEVTEKLTTGGILRYPVMFRLAGRVLRYEARIRSGMYSFSSGVSTYGILRDLADGTSTINPRVTIPEGLRSTEIARFLSREAGIDSVQFIGLMRDTSLIGVPHHQAPSLEGFLLPDTYTLYWQEDAVVVLNRMLSEFRSFFSDSLRKRALSLGMSPREAVTMASIVEAETRVDAERPIIAGLYYNRLRRGMKLEADPTVRYSLRGAPRRVLYSDLRTASPYNTYLNHGLPPGPINNPGRQSILAALYPARHQYLFFVADGSGGHRFAKTYSQHLANVRLYRRTRSLAGVR